MNFDLSEYEKVLGQQAMLFYHKVVEVIHRKFKHLIGRFIQTFVCLHCDVFVCLYVVAGLVEHESIPGLTSSHPTGSAPHHGPSHASHITVQNVLTQLSSLTDCLEQNCPFVALTQQILRQTFYIINAYMLNSILLRRELCHWAKGVQIR